MQRRGFIKQCTILCTGGIAISLLAESCGSIHYATSTIESNKIKISKAEFIDAKKGERKFIVIRSEKLDFPICVYKTANEYTAVYMQCSHQGCELHANKTSLVCPCHGSEFSTQGKVQNPPADKDLKLFKVTSDNENIHIEL